jgi:hypothetical protein
MCPVRFVTYVSGRSQALSLPFAEHLGLAQVVCLTRAQEHWLSRIDRVQAPPQNHLQMRSANVFHGLGKQDEIVAPAPLPPDSPFMSVALRSVQKAGRC